MMPSDRNTPPAMIRTRMVARGAVRGGFSSQSCKRAIRETTVDVMSQPPPIETRQGRKRSSGDGSGTRGDARGEAHELVRVQIRDQRVAKLAVAPHDDREASRVRHRRRD